MKNNQSDKHTNAHLIDSLARCIVYLVVAGVAAFTLLASTLAFGLLEFTLRVWFAIGQAVTGWFTW